MGLMNKSVRAMCLASALGPVSVISSMSGALAQQTPTLDVQRQVDDTFRQVLAAPGNRDATYSYAHALVDAGDFEEGIGALEGMLGDPKAPPSIRLELAVLYYRLGSYTIAAAYAKEAAADPRLDGKLHDQAVALAADAEDRVSVSRLTGNVTLGVRGQSNPTAGPSSNSIIGGGLLFPTPSNAKPRADGDVEVIGGLEHDWDLHTQNNATVVTTGTVFADHYFSAAPYDTNPGKFQPRDLMLVDITSGVRFQLDPANLAGLTLKPYVIGTEVLLDGNQYFGGGGAGAELAYRTPTGDWAASAAFELRAYDYQSRADIAQATGQDGQDRILKGRLTHELVPGQLLSADLVLHDRTADLDFFAYRSIEARLTYIVSYANPFGWDDRGWTSTIYGGPLKRVYEGADPAVDSTVQRHDTEYRIGATDTIPLSDKWSVYLQAEYSNADSNIVNYQYDNVLALGGVTWHF